MMQVSDTFLHTSALYLSAILHYDASRNHHALWHGLRTLFVHLTQTVTQPQHHKDRFFFFMMKTSNDIILQDQSKMMLDCIKATCPQSDFLQTLFCGFKGFLSLYASTSPQPTINSSETAQSCPFF